MIFTTPALRTTRDVDLTEFISYLRHSGLPHTTTIEGDDQVVWAENEQAAKVIQEVYRVFAAGKLPKIDVRIGANSVRAKHILPVLFAAPLTLTLLLATVICFPVTMEYLETRRLGDWLPMFTLTEVARMGGAIQFANLAHTIETGQWWRLVSPMLLHFGWLHLVFNSLWLWEFGRRIEHRCGALMLLLVVLVGSAVANLMQYYLYGVGLVGGMSGVVFALLGYAMIWDKRFPDEQMGIQPGIYIFMLVYLVVGFTGAFDFLSSGSIANGAHMGGLIGGIAVALLFSVTRARTSNTKRLE